MIAIILPTLCIRLISKIDLPNIQAAITGSKREPRRIRQQRRVAFQQKKLTRINADKRGFAKCRSPRLSGEKVLCKNLTTGQH
jgi:hypothetical protein